MARTSEAAVAKRLSEIISEFEAPLEGEEMTPMRQSKIKRAAELTLLAEITRASAIAGVALVSAVVSIEETAEKARREAGLF